MVAVRERIRINGRPIEEDMFAKYFFEVWDRLEKNTAVSGVHSSSGQALILPVPVASQPRNPSHASLLPLSYNHGFPRVSAREGGCLVGAQAKHRS